jgi:ribosomal protein L40E
MPILLAIDPDASTGLTYIGVALAIVVIWIAAARLRDSGTRVCPDCKSRVPRDANVCRYCGYRFEP